MIKTPIVDFVKKYEKSNTVRLHMPGHKGKTFLGCEALDITEIGGADSLYEAEGIIEESEKNATKLFGTFQTIYSTEGSSQCIRAMLYLAVTKKKQNDNALNDISIDGNIAGNKKDKRREEARPLIVAARNVHKSFLYAAALMDIDVEWLWSEKDIASLCKCDISSAQLETTLKRLEKNGRIPAAVYVTSPDYLGEQLDIASLAKVAHRYNTLLLVDNAHGAYLHFLEESEHPIDLGADLCCDSAHKTLPVLTGGAYLHIADKSNSDRKQEAAADEEKSDKNKNAKWLAKRSKQAMAVFGSTSPSYLIMESLDLCNQYMAKNYRENLKEKIKEIQLLKTKLRQQGWKIEKSDPLKITIAMPQKKGIFVSDMLRKKGIECEYAEENYVVFMLTAENTKKELEYLQESLLEIARQLNINQWNVNQSNINTRNSSYLIKSIKEEDGKSKKENRYSNESIVMPRGEQVCSIREAIFSASETIPIKKALGRICATPTVTCPPAIPIAVAGEKITEQAIKVFEYYGMKTIDVIV